MHWAIAKVRVKSFKSFGAAWTEVPINCPFLVGVVGANGSGKSALLEALAFAAGAPARDLRTKTLSELKNSSAQDQLCEVEVTLQQGTNASTACTLKASLSPDGTRNYLIDDRQRTAQQAKDWLRAHGVYLDQPSAVIRQATVTQLADENSPAVIGSVVADATGLARWQEMTVKAQSELQEARAALRQICDNVARLESLVAHDRATLAQLDHARALEHEQHQLLKRLDAAYQQQRAALAGTMPQTAAAVAMHEDRLEALSKEQQELEDQLSEAEKQTEARVIYNDIPLVRKVAGLREQVRITAEALAHSNDVRSKYEEVSAKLPGVQAARQMEEASLQDMLARIERLEEASDGPEEYRAHLQALRDMALAKQHAATDAIAGLQNERSQLYPQIQAAQVKLQHLEAQQHSQKAASSAAQQALRPLAQAIVAGGQQLSTAQEQLSQAQVQVQVQQTCMRLNQPLTTAPAQSNLTSKASCLSNLFGFKSPQAAQQAFPAWAAPHTLCIALSAIVGASLGVVIVDSTQDAKHLLQNPQAAHAIMGGHSISGTLRIWPLSNLQVVDRTAQQSAAQKALGADRVVLPLDLLVFEERLRPAMLRSFGGSVIAADAPTAAELANKFGLSAVTPDGTVTRKGVVTGGYAGARGTSKSEQMLARKVELCMAQARVTELSAVVSALEAEQQGRQAQLDAAEQAVAAFKQVTAECDAARVALSDLMRTDQALMQRLAQHEAAAAQLAEDLARYQAHTAQQEMLGSSATSAQAHTTAAQGAELHLLKQRAQAAQLHIDDLLAEEAQLSAQLQLVMEQVGSEEACQEGSAAALAAHVEGLADELAQMEARVVSAQEQLDAARKAEEAAKLAREAHAAHLKQLGVRKRQAQQEARSLRDTLQSLQAELKQQQKQQEQMHKEALNLRRDFPGMLPPIGAAYTSDPPAGPTGLAGGAGAGVPDTASVRKSLDKLTADRAALTANQVSAAEQVQMRQRRDEVTLFRERATVLEAGTKALAEGIAKSTSKVLATHYTCLAAVSERFEVLCGAILPGLSLALAPTSPTSESEAVPGGRVNHVPGVIIRFKRTEVGGGAGEWSDNLQQLSGGQRTMVCVALLLALACEGSRSSVVLLDEVDAALDEHNQAVLAGLLSCMADGQLQRAAPSGPAAIAARSNTRAGGMQVICVSHQAAFQKACDGLVHLSRQQTGDTAVVGDRPKEESSVHRGPPSKKKAKQAPKGARK